MAFNCRITESKITELPVFLFDISKCRMFQVCFLLVFQIFSLPNLKAVGKFKVSSRDGCRICKAGVISFRSKSGAYTLLDWSTFHDKSSPSQSFFSYFCLPKLLFYDARYFILHV